jgi:hypothetical protein
MSAEKRPINRVDVLMLGYYAALTVTGSVGVWAPSVSIEAQIGRAGAWVYTVGMVAVGLLAGLTVLVRARRAERSALRVLAALTALHAVFLFAAGDGGLQTGTRLLAGVIGLFAMAELRGAVYLSSTVRKSLSAAVARGTDA